MGQESGDIFSLEQELANFFHNGPDHKLFRLSGTRGKIRRYAVGSYIAEEKTLPCPTTHSPGGGHPQWWTNVMTSCHQMETKSHWPDGGGLDGQRGKDSWLPVRFTLPVSSRPWSTSPVISAGATGQRGAILQVADSCTGIPCLGPQLLPIAKSPTCLW